ncbi:hypothetical protein [Campylobacter fetus]|uniref:hypothetical protein n=1 Tax=Campylobacter fetus TaxID=196 RepID=UPI000708B38E|nr:hypothetical protein [Campylobacter fetus]
MNIKFKKYIRGGVRGFTVIEIVFVIPILGMLASILVPRLVANKNDAEIAKVKMQISAIRRGIEYYKAAQMGKGYYDELYCFTKCSPQGNSAQENGGRSKFDMDFLKTRNKGVYPMMLDQSRNNKGSDYRLLFKMVLATPIKGAENNNEKGWSRINNSGGDPYDGRYFLRVANKSIIFDYCSPTLHKYNDSMCSKGGKFIPSLNGKFFCIGQPSSATRADRIADCALLGEEYIDSQTLDTIEDPSYWSDPAETI